jgi:hypothetical protein
VANNEVRILISARDDASRVLAAIRSNAQGMQKDVGATAASFAALATAARVGAAVASTAILAVGVASVKLASDLNESRNAMQETFKDSAGIVEDFAADQAAAFNLSKRAAFEYAASLGGIFKASGLGTDAAADMSVQMVKLAADLASFKNLSIDEALTKIRSGLVGEAEPLRTVGVLLSETAVKAKAAEMGFQEVNGALTEGQKVQARAAIITQQLADAQGDVARTAGGLANQLRNVRQETEDLGAKLGQAFIPVVEKGLAVLGKFLEILNAIPTPILATSVVVAGAGVVITGIALASAIAIPKLNALAASYLNVGRAAGVAAAAQAAQTAVTVASGAAAAGRAVGGLGQTGVILGQGARTRFVGNASMQAIQAERFAASGAAAAGSGAAAGGTFSVLTRAVGQLALRVNPLSLGFGALTAAAVAAAFTMQEFAKQSRERSKDTIAKTTGQFAAEVKTGKAAAADLDVPVRERIDTIKKQIENLQAARAGLAAGVQQASPSALGVTGASSATKEIEQIDAAIRLLTGTLSNLEGPVLKTAAAFAKTEEEALAGGRGADIGGTADEIAKKFWETFKARMADSADREAQQAMASQRDAINNAIIDVFKVSGQKAAEAFKSSLTPDLMTRVNQRAAELARTLGIDLVNAMGLAIAEVGSYQAELNRVASDQDRKMQELRDLFSNEEEALGAGRGDNIGPAGGPLKGIDAINQLKQTTRFPAAAFEPVSGGGGSKSDPLGDAIDSIRDRFNADLAKALVDGGEQAFNDLAVQQASIRAEISRTAEDLMDKLGIKLPEALSLAADAVIAANDAIKGAVESTRNTFNGELAEAFIGSGGQVEAYNKKLAEQGPVLAEIAHRAQQLIPVMGVGFAEAYGLATQAVLNANEQIKGALESTQNTFKGELAEAFVKKAGGLEAYNKKLAEQGPILTKITETAHKFEGVFGIGFAEAYKLATTAVLQERDRLKNMASEGFDFMRKLATRRSAIGLNAIEGFNVRPQVPTFDVGGIVPGPKGSPVQALVHAGETILPTHREGLQSAMQKVLGTSTTSNVSRTLSNVSTTIRNVLTNVVQAMSPASDAEPLQASQARTVTSVTSTIEKVLSSAAQAIATAPSKGLPQFDAGGVVPGLRGSPVQALVHAGETILPTHKSTLGESLQKLVGTSTQMFSPTFAPTFSPQMAMAGGDRPINVNITRTIGSMVFPVGTDERDTVQAVEKADEPLLRQLRQTFAEAR